MCYNANTSADLAWVDSTAMELRLMLDEALSVGRVGEFDVADKNLTDKQRKNKQLRDMVKNVVFSGPCTIVFWNDGTKTISRCDDLDAYDAEKGILACMAKKLYKNTSLYNEVINKYVDFEEVDECSECCCCGEANISHLHDKIDELCFELADKDSVIASLMAKNDWMQQEISRLIKTVNFKQREINGLMSEIENYVD